MSRGLVVVLSIGLICACIGFCVWAKQEPATCVCGPKWEELKLWQHERAWDIDQIKKHLREQGHNIGVAPPRPVGSAK